METEIVPESMSDEELVRKIARQNDATLFAVLYDRYAQRVYNKCYSFSKSADEAEDLTQDVFLMLFIKLSSFKGRSKFSTWLYAFTYNFCVNYVNRNKQRMMSDKSDSISESDRPIHGNNDAAEIANMRAEKLKKALELIEPEDKKILLLKYQDDVSIKELTTILEIGESAVKMRLKRAKSRIVEAYNKIP
ncbi:RNA polymerase sigma-70 factor, ECF subfamily [Zobellia uliginosa]|uniref:RNA polymerase sigma-70 factor, ECF subfamily n=2 Tax=Zobellia uliginosa TaxID=143224 RepID=A0ABY1L2I6_9FLAO|nr:RNA polymerase sigma factor [Zobellia uliginosa]SIT15128.1 RNA polymerase sigma-70 factor, ECF subfamily [Zobellia uliginosa]